MIETPNTTEQEWGKSVIVYEGSDEQYENSGVVIWLLDDGDVALAYFGHCSCYGTWTCLLGGGICDSGVTSGGPRANWVGSTQDLYAMAQDARDPDMPTRKSEPDDFNYQFLVRAYAAYIKWYKANPGLVVDLQPVIGGGN